jgi:hypothetical protein
MINLEPIYIIPSKVLKKDSIFFERNNRCVIRIDGLNYSHDVKHNMYDSKVIKFAPSKDPTIRTFENPFWRGRLLSIMFDPSQFNTHIGEWFDES